jgi:hypothetical protein
VHDTELGLVVKVNVLGRQGECVHLNKHQSLWENYTVLLYETVQLIETAVGNVRDSPTHSSPVCHVSISVGSFEAITPV